MAIKGIFGFDMFPGAVRGGTGADQNIPVAGAGLTGTPYEADVKYTLTPGTGTPIQGAGVTGLELHKIGSGAERRNTLVLATMGGANTNTSVYVRPGARVARPMGRQWRWGVVFNYMEPVAQVASTNTWAFNVEGFPTNAAGVGNAIVSVGTRITSGGKPYVQFMGDGTLFPVVPNVPINIELVFSQQVATTGTIRLDIYIDGEFYKTFPSVIGAYRNVADTFSNFVLAVANINYNATPFYMCVSDIVITDETGVEGSLSNPIGPQIVLPLTVDSVANADWSVLGAKPLLDALKDYDDTTGAVSPIARSNLDINMGLNLKVGSVVNALQIFARSGKDVGGSVPRDMGGTVVRNDGIPLTGGQSVRLSTALSDRSQFFLSPVTEADRSALTFPDTGNVKFTLTTPP